jgi:hypothetical protein
MPQQEQFEILILGSGTGGKLVAWHMAQAGRRTAVVERRWIGGSCPNIACMPSTCGAERRRSATPRYCGARRQAADERGAASAGDRRETRLDEGSRRRERRPHSRLHHDRLGGRRGHGRRANGDDRRPAIFDASRRRSHAPDHGGGIGFPPRQRTSSQRATGYATNVGGVMTAAVMLRGSVGIAIPAGSRRSRPPLGPTTHLDYWAGVGEAEMRNSARD